MFLGGDQRDRDSATAYRMGVEVVATLAGAAIQGQIVGAYHTQTMETCQMIQNVTALNTTTALVNSLNNTKWAYMLAAIVISSLYFLCALILLFGVKERAGCFTPKDHFHVSYLTGLKLVMSHKPYLSLTFGFLFISLAFQLVQNNFALFLHACCWAGQSLPAHHLCHLDLCNNHGSVLAVGPGEVWKEICSLCGADLVHPSIDHHSHGER